MAAMQLRVVVLQDPRVLEIFQYRWIDNLDAVYRDAYVGAETVKNRAIDIGACGETRVKGQGLAVARHLFHAQCRLRFTFSATGPCRDSTTSPVSPAQPAPG